MDFESKTVLELRKIARENGVRLSAGINKAEIIQRLLDAGVQADAAPAASPEPVSSPEPVPSPGSEQPPESGKEGREAKQEPQQLDLLDFIPPSAPGPKKGPRAKREKPASPDKEDKEPARTRRVKKEEQQAEPSAENAPAEKAAEPEKAEAPETPAAPAESASPSVQKEESTHTPPEPAGTSRKPEAAPPHYRASWHNANPVPPPKYGSQQQKQNWNQNQTPQQPAAPRTPAGIPGFGPRFGPQATPGFGPQSGGFGPQTGSGFGPQASTGFGPQSGGFGPQASAPQENRDARESRDTRDTRDSRDSRDTDENTRPSFGPQSRAPYENRQNFGTQIFGAQTYGGQRQGSRGGYDARDGRASYSGNFNANYNGNYSGNRNYTSPDSNRREAADLPSIQDLLTPTDCADAEGILEVLPDGYGFLRSDSLVPSSHDIYIPSSLVRRYELRSGDMVKGKIRPQRDGEKYAALLYLDEVNGKSAERTGSRPLFDDLTPVYSSRRLSLDDSRYPDIRVLDLLSPIGVGSRTLMIFPPETGKRLILRHLADAISTQNPDVELICLLVDFAPEDVTEIRDTLPCHVMASTFDQTPDVQMRLIDLAQERALRLAEEGRDVVIIVDSLTRLARIAIASQQARQGAGGSISPNSLFRAKKLFGAARSAREGGSLTVIATLDLDGGTKLDDSMAEDFRTTANTEIQMDAGLARLNVFPPVQYQRSRTKKLDLILSEAEMEGHNALRSILENSSPAAGMQQVLSLLEKVGRNSDVLQRIKSWSALMSGNKAAT